MFGPHLMLDCYGCDEKKLKDVDFILRFLDELPEKIDMNKITPPQLINYPGTPGTFDKGGISAFVLISSSHISLHTFPHNGGYVSFDIFSCKDFDIDKTVKLIAEAFGAKKVEKTLHMRGKEFSKAEEYVPIVAKERKKIQAKRFI